MAKSRRMTQLENGEIEKNDAQQCEIYCSWPELLDAPEQIAEQINRSGGYLRIAEPGMTLNDFAHRVNHYKSEGLIPGSIRPQDLHWDGTDIMKLVTRLGRLIRCGTVNMQDLPGYEPKQRGVLISDAAGYCLLSNDSYGQQLATGNIAHIDHIKHTVKRISRIKWRNLVTPATLARQGVEIYGRNNLPDETILSKLVPQTGFCTIKTRCLFCGTTVKIRGKTVDEKPYYEIDTQPICDHLKLEMHAIALPENDGACHKLFVRHIQHPVHKKQLSSYEKRKRDLLGRGEYNKLNGGDNE
ncbi:MAG: hypothetical protein JEY79_07250 [Pseudodesulfovibrio sp.]|nr:hypothetical protein [Pseudodesulfovibrio sp.]